LARRITTGEEELEQKLKLNKRENDSEIPSPHGEDALEVRLSYFGVLDGDLFI
jgi:hypothetical protein